MTTLIIARHGNTFTPDQIPTRVGGLTDLPLVTSGKEQARKIGEWLKAQDIHPDITYSSELQRTQQTAQIALQALDDSQDIHALDIFNEIDYGPDENQTGDKVIARIGEQAIKDWDERAIVPKGWNFNPDECIQNWQGFATNTLNNNLDKVIFVVTSNGIARFAPHLAGNFKEFANNNKIKLSTGALGVLKFANNQWNVTDWNVRP